MPLADLIQQKFGVRTRAVENPKVSSLGTTAAEVFANNPNRLAWLLINLSGNTVYVSIGSDVASSKGVRLDANGGSASMIWDEDFDATGWALWGVASGASSAVYCLEIEQVHGRGE